MLTTSNLINFWIHIYLEFANMFSCIRAKYTKMYFLQLFFFVQYQIMYSDASKVSVSPRRVRWGRARAGLGPRGPGLGRAGPGWSFAFAFARLSRNSWYPALYLSLIYPGYILVYTLYIFGICLVYFDYIFWYIFWYFSASTTAD